MPPGPSPVRLTTIRHWKGSAKRLASSFLIAGRNCRRRRSAPSCLALKKRSVQLRRRRALLQDDQDVQGIVPNLERRWKETDSAWAREEIDATCRQPCPACNGFRLKPEALAVKIERCISAQVTEMSIRIARDCSRRAGKADGQAERNCRPYPQGNTRSPALPERCRPGLSQPVAIVRYFVGGESQRIGSPRRSAPA